MTYPMPSSRARRPQRAGWLVAIVAALALAPQVPAQGANSALPAGSAASQFRASTDIEQQLSNLPLLPPDKANRKLEGAFEVADLSVEAFLILMTQPEFLGMNIVLGAASADRLERPVDIFLNDMTLKEVFFLVLQLNGLKAVRFNESTLIILDEDDTRTYGVRQEKLYRLTYTTPQAVLDFINDNGSLGAVIDVERIIANEEAGTLLIVDNPDRIKILDHVVTLLDAKSRRITARIPVSHLEIDEITQAIDAFPEEIRNRIDTSQMVFSEDSRSLIVYETPEDIALLRDIIRNLDIGRKQALIDASIMEVSQTIARDLGLQLIDSTLTVTTLDKLWNLDRLRNDIQGTSTSSAQLSYLLQKQGGNTIANPKVRVIDGESATINIGQIRNVRVQTAQFASNQLQTTQQTTFNTQEVPIGVTLNVTPEIHNDGTVTLEMDISDEAIITINDFGVDRTTRNTQSLLRMRDGETIIMGGFINRTVSYDRTPIPILGRLPLLKNLFRRNQRQKVGSELVILLTPYILDYNPVVPKANAELIPDGPPVKKPLAEQVGYEDAKPQTKTTLTRWVETPETRTKVIYNAQGEVIYKKDFPVDANGDGADDGPPDAWEDASLPEGSGDATVPPSGFSDLYDEPLSAPEGAPAETETASGADSDDWGALIGELRGLLPNGG